MTDERLAYVTFAVEDAQAIVEWWRGANEAPGGCSPWEAICGMRSGVMALVKVLREAGVEGV